jgi:UvrD-like helicase C-terminal domain
MLHHYGQTYSVIKNYRSTQQLIEFANHFLPESHHTPPIQCGSMAQGPPPTLFFGSYQEIRDHFILSIKTSPFEYDQIAVLSPVKKAKPLGVHYYKNMGLYWICNICMEEEIPFQLHCGDHKEEKKKGHIQLYTFHGSKGLEWDQVFLLNFHWQTQGSNPTEISYRELRYLWYVAMTRAKKQMTLYGLNSKYIWKDLVSCPAHLYELDDQSKEMKVPQEGKDYEWGRLRDVDDTAEHIYYLDDRMGTDPCWREKMLQMDIEYRVTRTIYMEEMKIVHSEELEEEKKDMFQFFPLLKQTAFLYLLMTKRPGEIYMKEWMEFLNRERCTLFVTKKESFMYHQCMKIYRSLLVPVSTTSFDGYDLTLMRQIPGKVQDPMVRKWFEGKMKQMSLATTDMKIYVEYENSNQRLFRNICLERWDSLEKKRLSNKIGWEELLDILLYKYQKEEECKFIYKWFHYDHLITYLKWYWNRLRKVYEMQWKAYHHMVHNHSIQYGSYEGIVPLIGYHNAQETSADVYVQIFDHEKEQSFNGYRVILYSTFFRELYPQCEFRFFELNMDTFEIQQFTLFKTA